MQDVACTYSALKQKILKLPGLPLLNATSWYGMFPALPIASHGADAALPNDCNVVIIGSGITGAAGLEGLSRRHPISTGASKSSS